MPLAELPSPSFLQSCSVIAETSWPSLHPHPPDGVQTPPERTPSFLPGPGTVAGGHWASHVAACPAEDKTGIRPTTCGVPWIMEKATCGLCTSQVCKTSQVLGGIPTRCWPPHGLCTISWSPLSSEGDCALTLLLSVQPFPAQQHLDSCGPACLTVGLEQDCWPSRAWLRAGTAGPPPPAQCRDDQGWLTLLWLCSAAWGGPGSMAALWMTLSLGGLTALAVSFRLPGSLIVK